MPTGGGSPTPPGYQPGVGGGQRAKKRGLNALDRPVKAVRNTLKQPQPGNLAYDPMTYMGRKPRPGNFAGNVATDPMTYMGRKPRPTPRGEYSENEWKVAAKVAKQAAKKAGKSIGNTGAATTPARLPMTPMPKRPKTPGMGRPNRGPL